MNLPSGGNTGEFQALYSSLCNVRERIYPGTSREGWQGILGGRGDGASVDYRNSYGYYWSSTSDGYSAYDFSFHSGLIRPLDVSRKNYGFSVRCVKDY